MKAPDENPLVREILADESLSEFRDASLDRALVELHQVRRRHRMTRAAVFLLLPLALVWLKYSESAVELASERGVHAASGSALSNAANPNPDADPNRAAKRAEARTPASAVETITDEELFALFPNRALALIGPPGRQQLVFLDGPMHN